jgi:hypothetical protein
MIPLPKGTEKHRETVKSILLKSNDYITPFYIAEKTGIYAGTVSSRIRDLRLQKYGGYTIDRQKVGNVWGYKVISDNKQAVLFEN